MLQQSEKGLASDSRCSDQRQDNVLPDLIVSREDQRTGNARFFHFDVAAVLARSPVSELLEHTHELLPGKWRQARHGSGFWKRSGRGMVISKAFCGIRRAARSTRTNPSSRRAWSKVPRSRQLTKNSSAASRRLRLASSALLPCVVRSSGGQCAMCQRPSRFTTPNSLNSA